MEELIGAVKRFRYKGIIAIVFVYAMISVVLFVELSGIQVNYVSKTLQELPADRIVTKTAAAEGLHKKAVLLWNSESESSQVAYAQFRVMLEDMRVGCEILDLAVEEVPLFDAYEIVIFLDGDVSLLGDAIADLCGWVYDGGAAWFPMTLEKNVYSSVIAQKMGIDSQADQYMEVDNIYLCPGFMIGGGKRFDVPDPFDSARLVRLSGDCTTVYAAKGDENGAPLIWKTKYGSGVFVVNNIGIYDKAFRGFYAASYSLLEDVSVYPVINGSTFYLDDFPSQIPGGNNEHITRDYNTTVRDFYVNVWWPDMMNIADKYGIKYTGLVIECYDDAVDGTTDAMPDTGTFLNFGNMLLRKGGELGYHGYNHQPLCFDNVDYKGVYDYKTWKNPEAMHSAFKHLTDFCKALFPDVNMSVYVPPSNIMSVEGRELLSTYFPQIRTFSGVYFEEAGLDTSLVQEFYVNAEGVVDQPRIISGCKIDDFMLLAAVSELNMHFVNDHFTHPDDALDPERGAEYGWAYLKDAFDTYLSWLYDSAIGLRNLTGSEMSAAIQRYAAVRMHTEPIDHGVVVHVEHLYDHAFFLIRFNENEPSTVIGGALTHLTGDLYLLEAKADKVTIKFN